MHVSSAKTGPAQSRVVVDASRATLHRTREILELPRRPHRCSADMSSADAMDLNAIAQLGRT
jgi:hypothetical protein